MIFALDPGLATFGIAAIGPDGQVLDVDALATKPDPNRHRGGDKTAEELADRARRTAEVADWLDGFSARYENPNRCVCVVAEAGRAMGGKGKPSPAAQISLAAGSALAVMFARGLGVPLAWATPREWRRHFVPAPAPEFGRRQRAAGVPTDDELYASIGTVARSYVDAALIRGGRAASMWPHAMDAIGLGRWAIAASPFIRRLCKAVAR